MKKTKVIYRGRVQGVGFRMTTSRVARSFEVTGWVKNMPDGSVELEVEGTATEIKRFRQQLEETMAHHLREIGAEDFPYTGDNLDFSIRY